MKSLQQRLRLGLAISLVLLMGIMWWVASASLAHITENIMRTRLEHDAETLLTALQSDASGAITLDETRIGTIYARALSGHYFLVAFDDQKLRSRSLWDQDLPLETVAVGEMRHWHMAGPSNERLLVYGAGFHRFKKNITIMVAEDATTLDQSLRRFTQYFALGSVLILIILVLVQSFVLNRSFRSLARVRNELKQLETGAVSVLSEQVPSEIQPLVSEVNRLLQLLGQRLQRSRNAMGNLAHSLKHPLNLLMQLATREELNAHPLLVADLKQNTEQIRQLMERELQRARVAGGGLPGQRFKAGEELPVLIDVLQRVYHDKGLAISAEVPKDLECLADRNDMLELLGNLLDNACKWARHTVHCSVTGAAEITILVEDDGPGCDDAVLDQLTKRGVRIDESVSGHGLGLAIVKDIVELYAGTIHFEASQTLGGLKVTVRLNPL